MRDKFKKGIRITNMVSLICATILFIDSPTLWASVIIIYIIYVFWTIFKIFFDDVRYPPNAAYINLKNRHKLLVINWLIISTLLCSGALIACYVIRLDIFEFSGYLISLISLMISLSSLILGRVTLLFDLSKNE